MKFVMRYAITTLSPLHVGGERGIRPSIVDLKVFRRIEVGRDGKLVEKVAIPGSTIKGALRSTFEDEVRLIVLERAGENLYKLVGLGVGLALGGTIKIFRDLNVAKIIVSRLEEEQQVSTPEIHELIGVDRDCALERLACGIDEGLRALGCSIPSNLSHRLALNIYHMITSFLPIVCDPTSPHTSCISDTSLFDISRDRFVTFRFLLNIALLRKRPLIVEMCPVCLLFGGVGRASPLVFMDAQAVSDLSVLPTVTRVSIDRYTYAARRGKLFTVEYVPPGTRFEGEIHVVINALHPLYREDQYRKIVAYLLKMLEIKGLGGLKSVGYGKLRVEIESIQYSEAPSQQAEDSSQIVREIVKLYVENYLKKSFGTKELEFIENKLCAAGIDRKDAENAIEVLRILVDQQRCILSLLGWA